MGPTAERSRTDKLLLAGFLALWFAWSAATAGRGTARTCLSGACLTAPSPSAAPPPGPAPAKRR